MPAVSQEFLLQLLQACADLAPLYPSRYASEHDIERDVLDAGLDELRRRGLAQFTEWVKDAGQGYEPTKAGWKALATSKPLPNQAVAPTLETDSRITTYDRGEFVREALFEQGRPYACWALLILNLLFFAYGAMYCATHEVPVADYLQGKAVRHEPQIRRDVPVLYDLGALWPPSTVPKGVERQFWRPEFERLLLSLFLHGGVLHLFMNMYFLVILGGVIEAMWGWARFLAIYFVAGIVSGCVIILISRIDHANVPPTVGASGPLYGIFIAMIVWLVLNHQHLPANLVQDWSRSVGICSIMMLASNFVPHVSWQGHLGGAIGGLLASLLLHVQRFNPSRTIRLIALAGVPMIPAAFFAAVLWQAGWF